MDKIAKLMMDKNLEKTILATKNKFKVSEEMTYAIYEKYPCIETRKFNNKEYKIDLKKIQFLCSDRYMFFLDLVEVKKSTIHGYGVFAKKNINKGELITFYPGDIVKYFPVLLQGGRSAGPNGYQNDGKICAQIPFYSKRFQEKIKKNKYTTEMLTEYYEKTDYSYNLNKNYTIIGDPDFKDDMSFVGHLINDYGMHDSTELSIKKYVDDGVLHTNCYFYHCKGGLGVAIIAVKNIVAGEEILIHYGTPYWEYHNSKLLSNVIEQTC